MAGRIISGGYKGMQPESQKQSKAVEQKTQPIEKAGIGSRLGHAAIQGIAAPGMAVGNLIDYLVTKSGFRSPDIQGGSQEGLTKALGYTPEQVAPGGFFESVAQRGLKSVPTAALFGPAAAARSGLGSIVGGGLEYAGAGETASDLGQLAAEIGLGYGLGKIPTVKSAQKVAADIFENTTAKPYQATIIKDAMQQVEKSLATEVNKDIAKKVTDAFEVISNNITGNKINPHNAAKIRHSLYDLGSKLPKDDAARYVEPLTKGINNFFGSYAAENPAFYNALTKRDKLTQLRHMNTIIDKFADQLPTQYLPEIAKFGLEIFNKPLRLIQSLATNSEARNHYFDVVKAASMQDPALMIKNLQTFALSMMPEKEAEQELYSSSVKKGQILKGGYK